MQTWLATRSELVGAVVDAVRSQVQALGRDVILEPTKAAVMIKRSRTFAEVKPTRDGVEVAFIVSRRVDDPRVVRTLDLTARRIVHVVAIAGVADVDEQVQSWLAEAYLNSPP